ncbi:MAG: acylneuraminate cytidylyltransferase family protein [Lachnospiraceae bacterium]|nr:acylneuraminate cytidylyltransferase family protein [Lachnospiraceae bacterium]
MINLAVIPARSGSKGLKDKNIKELLNKPLLAYTVEAALSSGIFDTVHVSTDSKVYADIAGKYGADVPFLRSEEMSTDVADSWGVVKEVIKMYSETGKTFDMVTLLQPTSPLRTDKDIKKAYEIFTQKKANAVISVCEADHPPMWFHPLTEDGSMKAFFEEEGGGRRQDYETFYRMNGAIYMVDLDHLLNSGDRLFKDKVFAHIMDRRSSVDIDDKFDFDMAEAVMKGMKKDG